MYVLYPSEIGSSHIPLLQNFKYLSQKPIKLMLDSSQFLRILDAESKHLVTVSIFLPRDKYSEVERRLTDAFTSDSFDESAKAWNEERALIVKEALDQHLVPVGAKWVREYLREEVEDFIATSCASVLRKVRMVVSPLCRYLQLTFLSAGRCRSVHEPRQGIWRDEFGLGHVLGSR